MRKVLKNVWILFRSLVIFILLSFTTVVVVEHIEKICKVENFKRKGVYQEEISTSKIKYYKIDYEGPASLSFIASSSDCLPGNAGDILVSVEQNTLHPLFNGVVSFYAGGHAGYIPGVYEDANTYIGTNGTVEATMTVGQNADCDIYSREDWRTQKYFNEVMCLRVDMTDEERNRVSAYITSILGDPYNETLFFNTTNTTYCSDLISKGFSTIGKDLNSDGVTTSIWDLIVSKDAYISYYHYFDSNGVKYIYYLG